MYPRTSLHVRVKFFPSFLVCWNISLAVQAADPLLGKIVYYKDHAEAKIGAETVDLHKFVTFPAKVEATNGEWLWLGRAWVRQRDVMDLPTAFQIYDAEVRLNPNSANAWARRGNCWHHKNEYAKAIADYDQAIQLDPQEVAYFSNRGLAKKTYGDLAGAILDFDEAQRLNPHEANVFNNRGNAKSANKDSAGALREYDEAIKRDPKNVAAWFNRACEKKDSGDLDGALSDIDEVIRLDPSLAMAFVNRANIKEAKADYKGAIADCEQALRIDPQEALAYSHRAWLKHETGDYAAAIRDYEQAIRLALDSAYSKNGLAFLRATCPDAKFRDAAVALKLAEQVLSNSEKDANALDAKACALALQGKFAEAIEWEERALLDENFAKSQKERVHTAERIAKWKNRELWFGPVMR